MTETSAYTTLSRALWIAAGFLALGAGAAALWGRLALWLVVPVAGAAALAGLYARKTRPMPEHAVKSEYPELPPLVRNLFERLPAPLMLLDMGGRALFANHTMREVVETAVEHKHISSLLRMPQVLESVALTTATGEVATTEFSVRVPVERHFQAFTAQVGLDPVVVVLMLHDLTAQKRAEQTRVDFVANASHELRTPLAAVTGFIETLKGPARDDVEARDTFLDIMLVEAERMRRLINDLLSLSRIEMNEHVPPKTEVSAEELVRQAVRVLAPLAEAEKIEVSVEAQADLPPIIGERDELIQLLQNLIHNAIKYGRTGGRVKISLDKAAGQKRGANRGGATMVAIAISDDGEGIPQEAIPRLTERFYRVDIKRSREKGGTGLGLAIVKHIVNRHGGRLQIESKLGEGSTFTVSLPANPKMVANVEPVIEL